MIQILKTDYRKRTDYGRSQTERRMRWTEPQRVWQVKMKPVKESKEHLKIQWNFFNEQEGSFQQLFKKGSYKEGRLAKD